MSVGTIIFSAAIFLVTFAVSDWLADKIIRSIKKSVAKRRHKKLVKEGTQRMEDFGFTRVENPNIIPAEELVKKD